jgi:hypothetical protein
MTKYHLTKQFKVTVCGATKRACPRGAHIAAESLMKIKLGLADTREEKIFQNMLPFKQRVHVEDVIPETESAKPGQMLSKEQLYALEDYAGMDFFEINQHLNEGALIADKKLDRQVALIDSAFEVVKPTNPYVSFRGEKINVQEGETFEKAVMREFFPDTVIDRKSYLSTSMNPAIASHFATKTKQSVILEIRAKSGISLKQLSDSSKEEEMLLPRGSQFKVLMVKPYVRYQKINYCEESNNLSETSETQQIMTIVLEEV